MEPGREEPCVRQSVFAALREVALELWGRDGLHLIGERLGDELARRETVETGIVGPTWLPERWLMEWHQAVWSGPAAGNEVVFHRFIHRTVTQGFGRVRKLLLTLVTPPTLITRAAELWRDEHTHGVLTAHVEGRAGTLLLRDHPFAQNKLSALVLAESMRHAATLSRCSSAHQTHSLTSAGLEVRLTWT
jgi:hypothetical protein